MWFIGVEVEQETSAPPPKKILDPPLSHRLVESSSSSQLHRVILVESTVSHRVILV